ncbi:winged helix-turn-helix transcriptional regulator [Amycolatopsis magusensis]|uniref:winged helix-turn-helix transcriptional regulator n=1 Tax=Amycolatopsis magusensis TaxID=882444 RepID=UPI003C2E3401
MRARPGDQHCALDAVLGLLSGKWKVLLLWELSERPRRFGELRRSLDGISEKVLSAHLRELENDGLCLRTEHPGAVLHVEYSLTGAGSELLGALVPLTEWSLTHRRD